MGDASHRCVVVDTSKSPFARLKPVPVDAVKLEDRFWAPRLETLRRITLPSQYELLEKTGRIDNFRRASGRLKTVFRGFYFNDSDVYKWVEAAAYVLAWKRDENLESMLRSVVDEIVAAQDEDGYLNTYFTFERRRERWGNLRDMHELYCAGHLIQAAIAYKRATGGDDLFNVAVGFADHICSVFGPGRRAGAPGHPEVEMALVELYRETRRRTYLELAGFFIDCRGRGLAGGDVHHVDHRPFRELEEIVGHAVRAVYLCCGATDVYMETGDEGLWNTCVRLWRNMVSRKMYVTGGVGSRYRGEAFGEDYELPNEQAYSETCAAVANVMWNWRMLQATGDAKYADVMELALYNAALAGISLDGKRYFYVNPLADRRGRKRREWFDCACCPPNIARLLASLPGYFYSTSREGIWVHLYATCSAEIDLNGEKIGVRQLTFYPWDGHVLLQVNPRRDMEFSLFLRIPGWCRGAEIRVDGEKLRNVKPGTYLEIRREWSQGDLIDFLMPMPVELLRAHPRVANNACRVAIKRGPLIYCLEQVDNPGVNIWDVALPLGGELEASFKPKLLNGVVVVKGVAVADNSRWGDDLYRPIDRVKELFKPVEFTAIPYYAWANREPGAMTVWIRYVKP